MPEPTIAPVRPPNDPRELLEEVIIASGLSARRWAEDVAWRDERTIRRWISGESPIPKVVVRKLRALVMRLPHERTSRE